MTFSDGELEFPVIFRQFNVNALLYVDLRRKLPVPHSYIDKTFPYASRRDRPLAVKPFYLVEPLASFDFFILADLTLAKSHRAWDRLPFRVFLMHPLCLFGECLGFINSGRFLWEKACDA